MRRRKRFFKQSDFLTTFSLCCGNFILAATVVVARVVNYLFFEFKSALKGTRTILIWCMFCISLKLYTLDSISLALLTCLSAQQDYWETHSKSFKKINNLCAHVHSHMMLIVSGGSEVNSNITTFVVTPTQCEQSTCINNIALMCLL